MFASSSFACIKEEWTVDMYRSWFCRAAVEVDIYTSTDARNTADEGVFDGDTWLGCRLSLYRHN